MWLAGALGSGPATGASAPLQLVQHAGGIIHWENPRTSSPRAGAVLLMLVIAVQGGWLARWVSQAKETLLCELKQSIKCTSLVGMNTEAIYFFTSKKPST